MSDASRAVVLREFHSPLVLERAEVPEPEPGAVVARVSYGGVCGTDIHLHHGHLPMPTPVVLGHEAVGRVWRLGEGVGADLLGAPLREGDWIAWASSIPCGRCYWCLVEGERTLCEQRRVYGINQRFDDWPHLSGGWADFIYLQPGTAIVRLPEGVTPEQVISLGCAGPTVVHGVLHIAEVRFGDVVIVQGSGPVGMAAAMYSRLSGASKVILVGGPQNRLELASELGVADVYVDIFETTDPEERVQRVLGETERGRGADLVIECTGAPDSVVEGMEMTRRNGRYLVLGQYTDRGAVPINPHVITRKQLTVLGSWAFAEAHHVEYIQSLPHLSRWFDLPRLLTPYPLEDANRALADVEAGRVMKAVLATG